MFRVATRTANQRERRILAYLVSVEHVVQRDTKQAINAGVRRPVQFYPQFAPDRFTGGDSELDESSEGQREKSVALRIELASVAEVLRELFNLLEQYAPTWYTEEHHNRAVAACASSKSRDELARTKLRGLKRRVDLFDRGSKIH